MWRFEIFRRLTEFLKLLKLKRKKPVGKRFRGVFLDNIIQSRFQVLIFNLTVPAPWQHQGCPL